MDLIPVGAGIFAFGASLSWPHGFAEPD